MTYSIIGSGNVGAALARQFARSGIAVDIANTRGPDTLAALVAELGANVTAVALQKALEADVVILAVPFRAHVAVAAVRADWTGTIIVDAMNAHGVASGELKGAASSALVATAFRGAAVVKTFNQLPAKLLAAPPGEHGGRRVMLVSSDDAPASAAITALVADLGFAPIAIGKLDEGGALLRLGGPLLLQNLIKLG
jgi:predicted dinucleotide-binding enzyme